MVRRLLVFLISLAFLGILALIGYAYVGDLSPNQTEIREQVTIEVD